MYQKAQPDGKLLLILYRAQDGNVRFEISRLAVETMIVSAASKLAEKQGVGIDNAQRMIALIDYQQQAVRG